MDKNLKYIVIALAGGVGVYIIWKGNYLQEWFPDMFGPSTGGTGGTDDAAKKKAIADAAALKAKQASDAAAVDPTNAQKVAEAKRLSDEAAAATYCTQELALCPDGSAMPRAADCTWLPANCPAPVVAQPVVTTQDKIANAALADGWGALLNMDQWCFYAAKAGVTCPDPGDIDPSLYEGAWGAGTDRTTPIAVDTFWYLITVTDPSLGMNGLSKIGLAGIGWLT